MITIITVYVYHMYKVWSCPQALNQDYKLTFDALQQWGLFIFSKKPNSRIHAH